MKRDDLLHELAREIAKEYPAFTPATVLLVIQAVPIGVVDDVLTNAIASNRNPVEMATNIEAIASMRYRAAIEATPVHYSNELEAIVEDGIRLYGENHQVAHCVSELGEAVAVLGCYLYGRTVDVDIEGEIADVTLACASLRKIFGRKLLDQKVREKLDRYGSRLVEEQIVRNKEAAGDDA
jgi:hypothetical protein